MSSQFNDSPDDVTLHTRRASQSVEGGRGATPEDTRPADREVTLNTGIVLALFFALALLCAVFFGFGYSIGHKSSPTPVIAAAEPDSTPSVDNSAPAKPAAGSPASTPVPEYVPPSGAERPAVTPPKPPSPVAEVKAPRNTDTPATTVAPAHPAASTNTGAAPTTPAPVPPAAAPAGSGTNYVQVAAVSHQEDADVLLSALRRRGYAVQARSEANDKLIHVQLGPFSSRKDAEAMRQKLAGDGYNAFIK